MKKALLLLLLSNYLFGQQIDIKVGAPGQIFTDADKESARPLDYKNLELLNKKFNSVEMTFGGTQAHILYEKDVIRGTNGFIAMKRHLYMPFVELKENKQKLYWQEIDAQGKLKGECKLVEDDDYSLKPFALKVVNDAEGVAVSDNGEKAVHITSAGAFIYAVPQKLTITVFDENRNVLWTKVQEFPKYSDPDFSLLDFTVTNEGTVALSAAITSHSKSKKDDGVITLKIFVISKDDMKEGTLSLEGDKIPTYSKLVADPEGMLIAAGFYQTAKCPYVNNNGYYIANFAIGNANLINKAIFPFDAKFFEEPHPSVKTIEAGVEGAQIINVLKSTSGKYFLITCFGAHTMRDRFGNLDHEQNGNDYKYTFVSAYDSTLNKTAESIIKTRATLGDLCWALKAFAIGENIVLVNDYYLDHEKKSKFRITASLMNGSCKAIDTKSVEGLFNPGFVRRLGEKGVVVTSLDLDKTAHTSFTTNYSEALITVKPGQPAH